MLAAETILPSQRQLPIAERFGVTVPVAAAYNVAARRGAALL
jgi:hypothetical protein